MPIPKAGVQAGYVRYPDGSHGIMVTGGTLGVKNSDFLDLDTLLWIPKASLDDDIGYGASVPFRDSFLIVGGIRVFAANNYLNTIYYYNPDSDTWIQLEKNMLRQRYKFAAFMVSDDYANCD